jgi:hypothetical protein
LISYVSSILGYRHGSDGGTAEELVLLNMVLPRYAGWFDDVFWIVVAFCSPDDVGTLLF